ncbi:MAG TPA: hypothetical protein VFV23_13740 [Verrucomicrobiae bacterium]|nr:hypothetical protein [Verrucomicrobiae bacterium]
MNLEDITNSINGFVDWTFVEKIKFFAWYLHTYQQKEYLGNNDIQKCFDELHLESPSLIGPFIVAMGKKNPKEMILKSSLGYKLEARVRQKFDNLYGQRAATVQIHKLLSELPSKISKTDEQKYLEEVLICFRHKAFRAAVVMCWNLAFDHLCQFILNKHLVEFNAQLPKSYPKANILVVAKRDDFSELKESQILLVCKSANIISDGIYKILKEKLDRRNIAAHPSGVITAEPTAEEFIKDIIENVVLKLVP